jgi:hypothetical protein
MKKTIILSHLLALFIGLVFSNTASAGLFSNAFIIEDRYTCRIEYTQLYADTGVEKQKRVSKEFADDAGCKAKYVNGDILKKITDWLFESTNHIVEQTTWEGVECKYDNGMFSGAFGFDDWGPYKPCSIEVTQNFINEMTKNHATQISNKVKYSWDYPPKVEVEDD